ncbi:MAG TPA: hypothetical protein VGL65_05190 [Gemmatimonadales bacterium]
MRTSWVISGAAGALLLAGAPLPAQQGGPSYLLFVASRASGLVSLVRFAPTAGRIEHRTMLRVDEADPVDPVAIAAIPGGREYYVVTRRATGEGEVVKVSISTDSARFTQLTDTVRDGERVGFEPDAIALTPDSGYAWVMNAGTGPGASSLSVVDSGPMAEVARIATCAGGRGSRFGADGLHHYSVCSRDDILVEVDRRAMKVARRLMLDPAGGAPCAPMSLDLNHDGSRIVIGCAALNQVLEVDVASWTVARRIAVPSAGSAIAVTPDGGIAVAGSSDTVTNNAAASIVDLGAGLVAGTVALPGIVSGIATSPDSRYAFVTTNGAGPSLGNVTMIDLRARKALATIAVGNSADAITFWKVSPPPP